MKVLVFGKTGQVAQELFKYGGVVSLDRVAANLSNPAACAAAILNTDADIIVNAAAYTNVDRAESEPDLAQTINGDAPGAMAQAAADRELPFIHISTDYVFDGSGDKPWHETDAPAPLGVYGRSKLSGEQQVQNAGGTHMILRTSWVFSAHMTNFVKTILRLGMERDRLTIVADQIGGPTAAHDIAGACMHVAKTLHIGEGQSGVFHFAGAPDTSWADFARTILKDAGLKSEVVDIPSSDYPTPAKRPLNSRLDCTKITKTFAIPHPDWRKSLKVVLTDLQNA